MSSEKRGALPIIANNLACETPQGRRLFEGLNFSLGSGLTALVGYNGVGKSCLARILAGTLEPGEGGVRRNRAVRLLPQQEDPPETAVGELLADYRATPLGEQLLEGIDHAQPCNTLSGGQWMRVRLARLPRDAFLILDEPTNDLDRDGRAAVAQLLRSHRAGVLLISHDRECLELCDEILELSNRGLARYGEGWEGYVSTRAAERERSEEQLRIARGERDAARAKQQDVKERRQRRDGRGAATAARGGMPRILLGARKRTAQETSGSHAAAAVEKAESAVLAAREALDSMKLAPLMSAGIRGEPQPAQKLVAEARGFNIRFGDWLYARDLTFTWRGNLRIAIQGANGSGKSTLLRALRGEALRTRGELLRGELTTMYLDQRCSLLDDRLSVLDNVMQSAASTESQIRTSLSHFLFAGNAVMQKAGSLSGGERLRAALARAFLAVRKPQWMLLDEPTNNLDLGNIEFLESVVGNFSGPVTVVSHDARFLERCGVLDELVVDQASTA